MLLQIRWLVFQDPSGKGIHHWRKCLWKGTDHNMVHIYSSCWRSLERRSHFTSIYLQCPRETVFTVWSVSHGKSKNIGKWWSVSMFWSIFKINFWSPLLAIMSKLTSPFKEGWPLQKIHFTLRIRKRSYCWCFPETGKNNRSCCNCSGWKMRKRWSWAL